MNNLLLWLELRRWRAAGRTARLWWRDDDAVEPTEKLAELIDLADGIPLGLAVIPAAARPDLADIVAGAPEVTVLQHGWQHANHGGAGRKSEFPAERAPSEVAAELAAGSRRLRELFGDRFLPVLAPPWNRFAEEFEPLLAEAGLVAVSGMAPARERRQANGAGATDVHLDLVDWRGARGFVGEAAALGGLIDELRARRLDDPEPAIGLLTHHLVMDQGTASFLAGLRDLTRAHGAVRWIAPSELLTR